MLFSSDSVATYINSVFEPVWESVRPVPIVTIDFGNGEKITRTLHGNIATYLCNAQGTVYDILPGIYEPIEYLKQLNQFAASSGMRINNTDKCPPATAGSAGRARGARRSAAEGVSRASSGVTPGRQAGRCARSEPQWWPRQRGHRDADRADRGRRRRQVEPVHSAQWPAVRTRESPRPTKAEEIAGWKELVEDTRINESIRRRAIHEKLAAAGRVQPEGVKKWLFKDVLAADLDDPTLGIAKLLDNRYPFAEEDAAAKRKGK